VRIALYHSDLFDDAVIATATSKLVEVPMSGNYGGTGQMEAKGLFVNIEGPRTASPLIWGQTVRKSIPGHPVSREEPGIVATSRLVVDRCLSRRFPPSGEAAPRFAQPFATGRRQVSRTGTASGRLSIHSQAASIWGPSRSPGPELSMMKSAWRNRSSRSS
jgi:hypothetical protein